MAKAKYTPGKDGRFQTKVGTGPITQTVANTTYLSIPQIQRRPGEKGKCDESNRC